MRNVQTNYMFPHYFYKIGWILFIPSALFGIMEMYTKGMFGDRGLPGIRTVPPWEAGYTHYFGWDGMDELVVICLTISLLFIAFSKEKTEDEYIWKIRSESLTWAVMVNYLIIIIGTLSLYEFDYLSFLIINLFTIILLFIIKFRLAIRKMNRLTSHEE